MKSCGNGERAPLRTMLQNFLNHVETLEKKRNGGDDQYDKEFQELKLLGESLKGLPSHSCKEGEKEVNRRKNRYKDILPFDCTRVSLSEITGIPGSDYINANYIRGASGSHAYIASQGPLAHTVADFWRMVIECDVQVIIMACNEEESGKHKCECYWVDDETDSKSYGPYSIKLLKSRRMCDDFNLRTMELTYTNSTGETITRTVVQFHYWAWPDHGVPALVRPLLDMVRLIRDCQASETLPLLIHCSAGCGRTGTICAIDYVWGLLRAGKLTEEFSLFELIADMRRQRVAMVQTKDQYILVHRAVRELFIEQLKMIDAHPYENLDVNGHPLICPPQEIRIDPSYETIFVEPDEAEQIVEVDEEEDVLQEETDQIPWTVLQYQSTLAEPVVDSAPPLPDKKRKAAQNNGEQESAVVAAPTLTKPCESLSSSSSSSKESTPPASLERPFAKVSDAEPASETTRADGEQARRKTSPSCNLVRKSSILKLRAFFEKSNSEPRGDKKNKNAASNARKSSSFRVKESPSKFYRTLQDVNTPADAEAIHFLKKAEFPEYLKSQKLSLAPANDLLDVDGSGDRLLESNKEQENDQSTLDTQAALSKKDKDAGKPSLPIKRSKSMKVYRGFDLSVKSSAVASKSDRLAKKNLTQVAIMPAQCDIILSKSPSITYIVSKEKVEPATPISALELPKKGPVVGDQLEYCSLPLATSSLDRGKEQRSTKSTTAAAPTGGSLDRSVTGAQNKVVPTYVNVLLRNQEAANTSKLDDDTKQLLKDCQTYLMGSNSSEKVKIKDNYDKSLLELEKKTKDLTLKERRRSFKQAVIPNPEEESSFIPNGACEESCSPCTSTNNCTSFGGAENAGTETSVPVSTSKKVHEYEAIWLSTENGITANIGSETNNDNSSGFITKDSLFIQKSDEIRMLLNELRNGRSDDYMHVSSTLSKIVSPFPVARSDASISPRLHPERVLSELQELVERANRSHGESANCSTADVVTTLITAPATCMTTPVCSPSVTSPAVNAVITASPSADAKKNPYVNYPQPPIRADTTQASNPVKSPVATASSSPASKTPVTVPAVANKPATGAALNYKKLPQAQPVTPTSAPSQSGAREPLKMAAASSSSSPTTTLTSSYAAPQPSTGSRSAAKAQTPLSPAVERKEFPSQAPAFRPPPPYPTNLYVKLPPATSDDQDATSKTSPKMHRRVPPEYKAPPPVKRTPVSNCQPMQQPTPAATTTTAAAAAAQNPQQPPVLISQPVAPPRTKKQIMNAASNLLSSVFPMGPPVPNRSFSSHQATATAAAPEIDVDAVAAVMAAAENPPSSKGRSSAGGGSSSPTNAANKALNKALIKFHATAASFKTKFSQLGDTKEETVEASSFPCTPVQPKLERESSFIKPTVVYVGDGMTVVNTSETTTYVRKKQQYL